MLLLEYVLLEYVLLGKTARGGTSARSGGDWSALPITTMDMHIAIAKRPNATTTPPTLPLIVEMTSL